MLGGRRRAAHDAAANDDAVPLLPLGTGHAPAMPDADPRFTLDDDDVFDHASGDDSHRHDAHDMDIEAHPESVSLLGGDRSSFSAEPSGSQHTYPPARDGGQGEDAAKLLPLPPSYYDAMRPVEKTGFAASFAEFRREFREHLSGMPQYVPEWVREAAGTIKAKARRVYGFLVPHSRIAHMSYLVAGLWLLVVFTGPVFEATSDPRASDDPWDWAGSPVNHSPPLPFQGDGVVQRNASWAHKGCVTEADASSWSWFTWCHAITEFYLPLKGNDVSGQVYFLADPPPPLPHLPGSHNRRDGGPPPPSLASPGSPPESERDDRGSVHGTLRMVEYLSDPSSPEERKTAARVTIKAKYLMAAEEYFAASTVVHLARNGGQGIGIYTRPPPSVRSKTKRGRGHRAPLIFDVTVRVPKNTAMRGVNITTSSMDVILFDTLTSVSPTWRRSEPAATAPAEAATTEPYVDSLRISTGNGFIGIGNKLGRRLIISDRLDLASDQSTIALAGQIEARKGYSFSTNQGDIRFLPEATTYSPAEAKLVSQKNIILMSGAEVAASKITADARAFPVHHHGKQPGVWSPTSSLHLQAKEDVEAHLRVPTSEHVDVTAVTSRDMRFSVEEVAVGTPLRANVSGAHTEVSLGPTYVGSLFLRGPRSEDGKPATYLDPLQPSAPSKTKGKHTVELPRPATERVVDPAPVAGPPSPPGAAMGGAVDKLIWRPPGAGEDATRLQTQINSSYIMVAGHARAHALFL